MAHVGSVSASLLTRRSSCVARATRQWLQVGNQTLNLQDDCDVVRSHALLRTIACANGRNQDRCVPKRSAPGVHVWRHPLMTSTKSFPNCGIRDLLCCQSTNCRHPRASEKLHRPNPSRGSGLLCSSFGSFSTSSGREDLYDDSWRALITNCCTWRTWWSLLLLFHVG